MEAFEEAGHTRVEAEFINNYKASLWVPAEPLPSYRVDPQTRSVLITYGYFDDIYGTYRGQYMLPPMKKVDPGQRFRWRIEDPALLEKLLIPKTPSSVRLRVAIREFPTSTTRGDQPVDQYIEDSCSVFSKSVILRQ
ncbi:MAG: hypothetical protein JJE04_07755 [Acidobacteriia bacterium]|nr:hypothetical protein [Terriglobia bacterium]